MSRKRPLILLAVAVVALMAPWWASRQGIPQTPAQTAVAAAVQLASVPEDAPLELFVEPDDGTQFIRDAIGGAEYSIDLTIYQLADREVENLLIDAHTRGIKVRVILQNLNNFGRKPNQPAYDYLTAAGVPVRWAPEHFALSHQKTLLIDNAAAYVMSLNLTSRYYQTSRDFAVLNTDPADVAAIREAFNADWDGREIRASRGRSLVWSPGAAEVLLSLVRSASTTLDVYALLMGDYRITQALKDAAARGVAVRVVMTYDTQWKSALIELTRAGVSIRTFASSASTFIHAKAIVADGVRAYIGSQNFSVPSLDSNRELGLLLGNGSVIEELHRTFERDWARARPYVPPKEAFIMDASGVRVIVVLWHAPSFS